MLTGSLANRLRVVDWITRHPDVAGEAIERPLIVIGMFRAGTTLLSRLLDQDPHNRALLMWEAGDSVPPPTPADHRARPARRRGARQQRDAGADQPDDRGGAPRAGRRGHRVHHRDGPGLQEPHLRSDRQRARLRRVAAGRRPTLGLRVPPLGAPGPAERRRARAVDAQEPAPRDRARVPHRGVPRRPARAPAPRPRRPHRVGLQSHHHAVVHVHRCRPPPLHRPTLAGDARRVDPSDRGLPRRPSGVPDRRRAVRGSRHRSERHGDLDLLRVR